MDTEGTQGWLMGVRPLSSSAAWALPTQAQSPTSCRACQAPAPCTVPPRPFCQAPPDPGPQGPLTHHSCASGQPPASGHPCGARCRAGSRAGHQSPSPRLGVPKPLTGPAMGTGTWTPAPHSAGAKHPPSCSAPAAGVSGPAVPAGCRASCGQSGVLTSPWGAHQASPSPTPRLGAPGSPHVPGTGGQRGPRHHLCPR